MLVYFFVPHYPSLFKPYYDAQFSSLIDMGHDVRVFSMGNLDARMNEKVTEYRLEQRTQRYYGGGVGDLPRYAPEMFGAFLRDPIRRTRAATRLVSTRAPWRRSLQHTARMLTLPTEAPDLCVVHGGPTMRLFPWLGDLYPSAAIAFCYHGGGLWGGTAEELFGSADVVFTNTEYSIAEAISLGCPPEKLAKLPVGFDLSEYRPRQPRTYRPGGVLRIVSASRFGEEKGHVYALEALALLHRTGFERFRYTIIGGGKAEMRALLESRVRELDLGEHVHFAGAPGTREVIEELGDSDLLLLASIEYRGIVEMQAACVQEALLMGALTITTRTGGVPESIPDEMRRFSVPTRDSSAIARAIQEIDALSDTKIRELAEKSRTWVVEHYDINRLNARMLREVASRTGLRIQERSSVRAPLQSSIRG